MPKGQHAIRLVAQKTGLSPHVIRVWERRYTAVTPTRSGTNRRLYTDAELERLQLLARACRLGHNIGSIARLPEERLRVLAADCMQTSVNCTDAEGFVATALESIKALDTTGLESVLLRGAVSLGNQGVLCRAIAPLTCALGTAWQAGEITSAQEHFASAVIRVFLVQIRPFALPESAPMLVVATPNGQLHELGALLVAAAAGSAGWRVTYLGAGLPAVEIAGAATQAKARAVALSVVYPEDDPDLSAELIQLHSLLPPGLALLVGGRAVSAYRSELADTKITFIGTLADLYTALNKLRTRR